MNPTFLQAADSDILNLCGVQEDFKKDLINFQIINMDRLNSKIAEFISLFHHYIWVGDTKGEFYKYYMGCWYPEVDISLNRLIRIYVGLADKKINQTMREDIRALIKENRQLLFKEFNEDRDLVNFKNGWLNLKDWSFKTDNYSMPYETKSTVQIPWDYHADGQLSLKFLPWLINIFEGDWKRVDLLLKATGYAITLHVKYQRLFMLKGAPRTGKSTFLNILHALVGDGNTSAVSLQRLAHKFGTWGIVGKIVNFHADIPTDKPVSDTSAIKTLIDDTIDYEVKGGGVGIRAKNITKHFFSTNRMPPVKGLDLAYARRWIIIEFNKIITLDKVVADFENTIIYDNAEMEAVLSLVMDAYKELTEEGQFISQTPEEVLELIQRETDTVYRFIQESCEVGPHYQETQDGLYNAYVDFATADGCTDVLKKGAFTVDLYAKGYSKGRLGGKDASGKRPYTYTGLKLKDSERGEEDTSGLVLGKAKSNLMPEPKNYGEAARKKVKTIDELIEEKRIKMARQIIQEEDDSMETIEPEFDGDEDNGKEEI